MKENLRFLAVSVHAMAWVFALSALYGCDAPPREPLFVTTVPWALAERWMNVDTHTHTRFSDGALNVAELADSAREHGCHGIAITDHTDEGSATASSDYFAAIAAARAEHDFPYILAGVEWNVPPYAGREHVAVLAHPELEAQLQKFKATFETGDAAAGFKWLAEIRRQPHDVVAFYNHPSRKDFEVEENLTDFLNWTKGSDVLIGFEGGPGHQRKSPRGDYFETLSTVDGWDPMVANVGDVWDRLLDVGVDAWGALATSDFHNAGVDFAPCEFSRTHVLVPEVSEQGILMGLRAGAFWGEMGRFLKKLDFRVTSPGLIVPAVPGESFTLGEAPGLRILVDLQRTPEAASQALEISLIGNAASGFPEVIEAQILEAGSDAVVWSIARPTVGADQRSMYLRLRVRSTVADGMQAMAYSNAVRVFAAPE